MSATRQQIMSHCQISQFLIKQIFRDQTAIDLNRAGGVSKHSQVLSAF